MTRTIIAMGFSFVLAACGGAVDATDDTSTETHQPDEYRAIIPLADSGAACPKAPAVYACETDESGREWWTLTEGCKTQRYACDLRPSPACGLCREGDR